MDIFKEFIKYDFLKNNKNSRLPKGISNDGESLNQRDIHNILKDERILENYLFEYKDLPTKKTIQNIEIASFKFDILKIIEDGYDLKYSLDKVKGQNIYILFVYQKGVINRCKTYDITKIVKELI